MSYQFSMSGLVCPHCGGRIDLFKTGDGERAALEMGVPFLGWAASP
jgi:ATP-binding protein involved in chromosome partitioning